jgi:heme/copper-type cytochrome/quinol oxidase subunit 4
MSEQEHAPFSANKIMVTLLILTALEVAWGTLIPYDWKFALWGGLLGFAFWKGILIFMYFMHMKFEGWICKALIAPTPFLIAVVFFALLPDVALNERLIHDVGDQLDEVDGTIAEIGHGSRAEKYKEHGDEDPEAVPASH